MKELKDTDIKSYNEIKESTKEFKETRGGFRANALTINTLAILFNCNNGSISGSSPGWPIY